MFFNISLTKLDQNITNTFYTTHTLTGDPSLTAIPLSPLKLSRPPKTQKSLTSTRDWPVLARQLGRAKLTVRMDVPVRMGREGPEVTGYGFSPFVMSAPPQHLQSPVCDPHRVWHSRTTHSVTPQCYPCNKPIDASSLVTAV